MVPSDRYHQRRRGCVSLASGGRGRLAGACSWLAGLPYELTPPLPPFPPFRFALMVRCRIDSVMTPWRS